MRPNGNTTEYEEQEVKVREIRSFLKDSLNITTRFYLSSWFIRRYLRARKFDIQKTKIMIEGYFKFKERMDAKIKRENKPASKCIFINFLYGMIFISKLYQKN
jgi:hypothetical protein